MLSPGVLVGAAGVFRDWEIYSDNEVSEVCDAGCQSALLLAFFPQGLEGLSYKSLGFVFTYKVRFSISEGRLGDRSEAWALMATVQRPASKIILVRVQREN